MNDGGFILAGTVQYSVPPNNTVGYVVKVDENFVEQWHYFVFSNVANGSTSLDYVIETKDGGYVICGQDSGKLLLLKLGGVVKGRK